MQSLLEAQTREVKAHNSHKASLMSNFGETLFGSSNFIRWTLSPFLLLFLVLMPMMVETWTLSIVVIIAVLELAGGLLFVGFWVPAQFRRWTSRILAAIVFLFYSAYFADELFFSAHSTGVSEGARRDIPLNAIAGFLIIGLPCLWYALSGRFGGFGACAEKKAKSGEDFDDRVRSLEEFARQHPKRYRMNVLLLGLVGYIYIFGILGLLCITLAFLVYQAVAHKHAYIGFKLAMPLAVFAYLILKSLWVRISPPEGMALDERRAPLLFAEVKSIREALHGPRVDRILVTGDFNAGVVQIPRLGIIGWPRNYLMVGLPMLLSLSPAEFRAVLLHEFGHLSGGHGISGTFVYRIRVTWNRLMEALEENEHWGAALFSRFFRWYAPYFSAYSFVLARDQEYEADRVSAELTSTEIAAGALVATVVRDRFLENIFWPRIYEMVKTESAPPFPYKEMMREFPSPAKDVAAEWLSNELKRQTETTDTHPALTDRLAALGRSPALPLPPRKSAAAHFLGASLTEVATRMDAEWREGISESWQQRREYLQESGKRLAELREMEQLKLSFDEEWEMAAIIEAHDGGAAALPLYQALLNKNDAVAGVHFAVGRLLLGAGDERGMAHIDRAMELHHAYVREGCSLAYSFLAERGRKAETGPYVEKWEMDAEIARLAEKERNSVSPYDELQPHRLNAEQAQNLSAQLAGYREIKEAWLSEKKVRHMPEKPLFILMVSVSTPWYRYSSDKSLGKFAQKLASELQFPGEIFILMAQVASNKPLWKKMQKTGKKLG